MTEKPLLRTRLKVLLVDDHVMLRQVLRSFLKQQEGLEIVAEAETGRIAVELAGERLPDVVIMDIAMPDMNGMEATRHMKAIDPGIKVIALSMHSDTRYVEGMFEAGANAFLLKTCETEELLRAIDAVRRGKKYITPEVADVMIDRRSRHVAHGAGTAASNVLTVKEREVLQLLAEGHTSRKIAEQLGMALKTAETHRGHVMEKLNLHSIAALTKYAIREGITSVDA